MATRELESVEVRPISNPVSSEIEQAAETWVSAAKSSRRAISVGEVFTAGGHEFGVVSTTPSSGSSCGTLTPQTKVSIATMTIPVLDKVQVTCLEDGNRSDDVLYQDFIRPLLLRKRLERKTDNGRCLMVLCQEQVVKANEVEFGVRAMDPNNTRYGAVDPSTAVFVTQEETPTLAKVHVLPFEDSLPVAYTYCLFRDFLQPFFQSHPFAIYGLGDVFTYNGVRFRVMATDPEGLAGRVGTQTIVYYQGDPLRPTIWDLMPSELREDLQRLPRGLQMLLLNTMANEEAVRGRLTEVQEVLRRGQGLDTSDIDNCGQLITWKAEERHSDTQQTCMVCLSDFAEDEKLRDLHCSHHFHVDCIDEWLRRSPACPICKQPCSKSSSTTSSSDPGASANTLRGVTIICDRGEGKIIGYDVASKRFQVRIESSGREEMLGQEDFVQAVQGVHLIGLQNEELNGTTGQIVGFDSERARYQVYLENDRVLAVKPEHCILPDGVIARVEGLREEGSGGRWNGQYGRIVSFDKPRMRHVLAMQPRGQLLSVKAKNLRV